MILRLDKGNDAIIIDRKDSICGMNKIIKDGNKFKLLTADPLSLGEKGHEENFKKWFSNKYVYKSISGSPPARMIRLA